LEASSVGCTARARLGGGGRGVIDGVFDGAINVALLRGLVCIVPDAAERGPLNVTLQLPVGLRKMSSLGAKTGDKVRVRGGTLELCDRYRVAFRHAAVYWPKREFTASVLEDEDIAVNLGVVRKTALRFGKMAGLGGLLAMLEPRTGGAAKRNLNIFASAAIPRIVCLERAFSFEDENLMAVAVGGLVGLGPGLTPSSDDMLAGLVLMCVLYTRSRGSLQRASQLISQATYAESRGRTTLLSEECLRQAALGRGNEPVARLCEALLTARPIVVERATKHVLKIGETSGTDTTLGVVMGTMLCTGMPFGLSASESE
jgi:hypothetical protein